MKTVALKMVCDRGWMDPAGVVIAKAVLVDLNLDTGLVTPHFESDPEALDACGPAPACGLLFEPAGLDGAASLILCPAWDFAGKATGFHISCQSLSTHKQQLKQWAAGQENLSVIKLCYRDTNPESAERLAA